MASIYDDFFSPFPCDGSQTVTAADYNCPEYHDLLSSSSSHTSQPVTVSKLDDPELNEILEDLLDGLPGWTNPKFIPYPQYDIFNMPMDNTTDLSFEETDSSQSNGVQPFNYSPTMDNLSQLSNEVEQESNQFGTIENHESEQIQVKNEPRVKFRPRTEKESKDSAHYLLSDDVIKKHPTIGIPEKWRNQNNYIEVTLVDKDRQPHPYAISNKEKNKSNLIRQNNETNTLYFQVTENDFITGEKSFLIEYIKSKQNETITKENIHQRQLDQSMLRFTRFYQIENGSYERDQSSVAYSRLMTENYGEFRVENVFPPCGPMSGNYQICVVLKGHFPKDIKDSLKIYVVQSQLNWQCEVTNKQKAGNLFTFEMVPFPFNHYENADVRIIIQYEQNTLYQMNYRYMKTIDEALGQCVQNNSTNASTSKRSMSNDLNFMPAAHLASNKHQSRSAKRPKCTK